MKAKEMTRRLQKIVDKHGNMDVLFDTEAQCFDVHLVDIESVYYLPAKMGLERDTICLTFNWQKEPHHTSKD